MRALADVDFDGQETPFSVQHVRVQSAISTPFSVHLMARSEDDDADLDAIVGAGAGISIAARGQLTGATSLAWTGVCTSAELVSVEPTGVSTYAFTIAPYLWLLTQRRNYRVFQRKNALDIAKVVLDEWGIAYAATEVDADALPKLDYRVQHGESDFNFVSRVLEEAGIAYYFRWQDDASQVFLTDRPETAAQAGDPIPFRPGQGAQGTSDDEPHVSDVYRASETRVRSLVVRDYDFRRPNLVLSGGGAAASGRTLEVFEYSPGQAVAVSDDSSGTPVADAGGVAASDAPALARYAQRRLDGHRASGKRVAFSSNVVDLAPGMVTSISEHPRGDLARDKKLLVLQTTLEGAEGHGFHVTVQAVFADAPFEPQHTAAKPLAAGLVTATVVGPSGDEIHTDEYGRVRVQFPWDREGALDEHSSCWIRVSQGWAGAGYGFTAIPRVGQEVLVGFLGADPDQPVIVGRLHNALEQVPYPLPANKAVSGWKSSTTPGSDGFNELRFDDTKDAELVYLQAQKDLKKLVKNDENEKTTANRHIEVGGDLTVTVGGDRGDHTKGSLKLLTDGVRKEHVKGDAETIVEGAAKRALKSTLDYVVTGVAKWLLKADRHLHVSGDDKVEVGGKASRKVSGDLHEKAGGKWLIEAGDEIHIKGGSKIVIEAATQVSLVGPGGFVDVGQAGVTIKGTLVKINSGGSAASGSDSSPDAPDDAAEATADDP